MKNQENTQLTNNKKISNARLALLIAVIPVCLFIAAFFIRLY